MFLSSVQEVVNSTIQNVNHSPDNLLRAIVDACVSNVAVLDESGALIYASKAWGFLERSSPERSGAAPSYFESFRRFTPSEFDEEANITLADDIQHILYAGEKEFHRKYFCHSLAASRPFLIHAARLNLPGPTFRILITHEEPAFVRNDFRDSKERLLDLLGTKILSWEGEVKGQRFTYVSEHALEMLGYPVGVAWRGRTAGPAGFFYPFYPCFKRWKEKTGATEISVVSTPRAPCPARRECWSVDRSRLPT